MSSPSISLKPRYNPLLWAQLRPSARPATAESSQNAAPSIPLIPENKMNTSLRVILHDTKSALEQFSDRLGSLLAGVEHARRQIEKVNQCFADGHEKVLEELTSTVNRSQKGLLEALGSPAQAVVLEEVRTSQQEIRRKLDLLEDKSELVQKQLHTISEQQGHVLTALAGITPLAPLLNDSPRQQNQIISTLTSLMPVLPLVQGLADQLKGYQQDLLPSIDRSVIRLSEPFKSQETPAALQDIHHTSKMTAPTEPSVLECVPANVKQTSNPSIPSSRTLSSAPDSPGLFLTLEDTAYARKPESLTRFISPLGSGSIKFSNLPFSSDGPPGPPKDNPTHLLEEDVSRTCKRQRRELLDGPRHNNARGNSPPPSDVYYTDEVAAADPSCRVLSINATHGTHNVPSIYPRLDRTLPSQTHKLPPLSESKSCNAPRVPRSPMAMTALLGLRTTATASSDTAQTSITPNNLSTPHPPGSFWKMQTTMPHGLRVKNLQRREYELELVNETGTEKVPESLPPTTPPHRSRLMSPHGEVPISAMNGLTTSSCTTSGNSDQKFLEVALNNDGMLMPLIQKPTKPPPAIPPRTRHGLIGPREIAEVSQGKRDDGRSVEASSGSAGRNCGDAGTADRSAVTNGEGVPTSGGRIVADHETHVAERANRGGGSGKINISAGANLTGLASYDAPLDCLIRKHSTRPAPQRILLNDTVDEDADIDMDWGDM